MGFVPSQHVIPEGHDPTLDDDLQWCSIWWTNTLWIRNKA